jgi:rod shape-determining protein MreC
VLSFRPNINFDTLVISRGSRDGVKLNSVVVAPAGVVGHVYDVGLTTSAVLLLTDSYSAVGAMVQRPQSRAIGVCKGSREPLVSMLYLARDADVKVGDIIVTSGRGGDRGIYPSGLPIGTVVEVQNDASGSTRHVSVKPAVDASKLEEVYVLR